MTRQERRLWYEYLCRHPARFRRQKAIGNYIVDFYSFSAKLVVEIDGSQHYAPDSAQRDRERDAYLNERGLYVLRISNYDVDTNFEGVCLWIDKFASERLARKRSQET
ncbi:MAG: endonuclease domain-containing protein [Clostridiales bacterium]|nr:endonuclease domain-containing protein [Clostridiales bacterium]